MLRPVLQRPVLQEQVELLSPHSVRRTYLDAGEAGQDRLGPPRANGARASLEATAIFALRPLPAREGSCPAQ